MATKKTSLYYDKPENREKALDKVLLDKNDQMIDGVEIFSSKSVFIMQEETRDRVTALIQSCPNGEELLAHIKIAVIKKKHHQEKRKLAA